ncbi:unnamed protein product [Adineta steineri]|uniref:Pentatricopeptide repeat-containing protein n=1 Tax=Adineta steineri TaxID=433720 RepID=A0A814E354_9BILA|nr:unnamed protein product [Adineta steineri]CAF1535663.1 unnamed protein product [Adineta steineri]CAF1535943.1 unnamed protein product [Adineta steineri]
MRKLNDKKEFEKAIDLFSKAEEKSNETISALSINQVLKFVTNRRDFQSGLNIHQRYLSLIEKNSFILVSLIHFYMDFGNVNIAEELFNKSKTKTIFMCGAMMKGYIKNNQANKAIDLFHEIKNPDEVNIILLFNACAQLANKEALHLIEKVLKQIPESFKSNPRLLTSLLDALMKCGDVTDAQLLFSKSKNKTVPMYGTMMNGFNKDNKFSKILDLFNEMKINRIQGDVFIYLDLIKALAQIADYSKCQLFIKHIPDSFLSDNQIQNALIDMWVN